MYEPLHAQVEAVGFEKANCMRPPRSNMRDDIDKRIQAGMNDFIAKPVQQRELAEIIDWWLAIATDDNLQRSSHKVQGWRR